MWLYTMCHSILKIALGKVTVYHMCVCAFVCMHACHEILLSTHTFLLLRLCVDALQLKDHLTDVAQLIVGEVLKEYTLAQWSRRERETAVSSAQEDATAYAFLHI